MKVPIPVLSVVFDPSSDGRIVPPSKIAQVLISRAMDLPRVDRLGNLPKSFLRGSRHDLAEVFTSKVFQISDSEVITQKGKHGFNIPSLKRININNFTFCFVDFETYRLHSLSYVSRILRASFMLEAWQTMSSAYRSNGTEGSSRLIQRSKA